ncbi:hypothetical protein [Streptomyces sp. NBC_01006]|uniref:golvesin C-terminal-like domain-containing protein n=1 Tax=Streptomyces sp. NBC_01006 TaxID=2903716 RepID=UPI002F9184EF|nr:hypothetical protein OG509_42635 [Streptomyces sp. NBC_01006]
MPAQADEMQPPRGSVQGWNAQPTTSSSQPSAIPERDRSKTLGAAYKSSKDTAFTTSGDGSGFHLLTADEAKGYGWKTAATLREDGFDADSWIGNACLTESGRYAAVAYAPRTFTNKPELMVRGAFAAVVDLTTGKVSKLPFSTSLAYFSPGCGNGEQAVFTQLTHDGDKEQQTRLLTVDARSGKAAEPVSLPGQVTSAIPTNGGIVAAHGNKVVRLNGTQETELVRTTTVPFQLTADADGGLTFIERDLDKGTSKNPQARAQHLTGADARAGRTTPVTVASGSLDEWDLSSTSSGQVFITGKAKSKAKLPSRIANPGNLAKGARMSTLGHSATSTTWADGRTSLIAATDAEAVRAARTRLDVVATKKSVSLDVKPQAVGDGAVTGRVPSPVLASPANQKSPADPSAKGAQAAALASPDTPSEGTDERYCAVPRNDAKKQAFQPTPRQVEWAVDQAVVGKLDFYRAAGWKNTGMGGYQPQGLFPPKVLDGDPNGKLDTEDGDNDKWHIPAGILLGITAQESNMWQATRFAVPGVTSNSLIGNYYGVQYTASGTQADPWRINWSEADCGYGITQATDGMRLAGKTKAGETALSTLTQEAVALDYTANIAYGAQILSDKWNQTNRAGMKVNDGHPRWIENWFYALWAYNSGFYETADDAGHKGLGWTNNPANPLWKANRTPFLENAAGADDYSHAAQPQNWPYPEKVIGWAARPLSAMFAPGDFQAGYKPSWWNNNAFRTTAKPPIDLFCNATNSCNPSKISNSDSNDPGMGACTLDTGDKSTNPHWLHCWWNQSASWKKCVTTDGSLPQCGSPIHRFNTSYPEQPDAASYPPRCTSGLPAGALIVDDLPNGTVPAGSDSRSCGPVKSDGSFTFTYQPWTVRDPEDGLNVVTYPGKMDTHQIGAAYQNHFWFTHTRSAETFPAPGDRMKVTGTWTLGRKLTEYGGQAKVYAHIPDHGAQTSAASYKIATQWGTQTKTISQKDNQSNKWVDLGGYRFGNVNPQVTLDNFNGGDGSADIAFDAIAFVPGDYSGMPGIRIPAEDPNVPDIDFVGTQKVKVADPAGMAASKVAAAPSTDACGSAEKGVTSCAKYTPSSSIANKTISPLLTTQAAPPLVSAAAVSPGPVGWCKNESRPATLTRTQGCLRGLLPLVAERNGVPIGGATIQAIQEISLDPKSETFTTWTELSLVNMTGISSTSLVSFDENCWPTTGCAESKGTWTGSTTWTSGDAHTATRMNTYKWNKTAGAEEKLNLDWISSWTTPQAAVQAIPKWSNSGFEIRCDNKVGGSGSNGCVFPKHTPTLTMRTHKYPAAAAYYWVMMEKLSTHPGSEKYKKPLHRLADESKAKDNRDKICMLAVAEWRPHADATGTSCDEYPFAKSRESGGQSLASGKFCVQMYQDKNTNLLQLDSNYPNPTWNEICGRAAVPASQNTAAGGDLGRFTKDVRLLDNDAYFVETGWEGCDMSTVCTI